MQRGCRLGAEARRRALAGALCGIALACAPAKGTPSATDAASSEGPVAPTSTPLAPSCPDLGSSDDCGDDKESYCASLDGRHLLWHVYKQGQRADRRGRSRDGDRFRLDKYLVTAVPFARLVSAWTAELDAPDGRASRVLNGVPRVVNATVAPTPPRPVGTSWNNTSLPKNIWPVIPKHVDGIVGAKRN